MKYLIAYLLIVNFVGLFLYRSDKKRSEKNKWRIKESTLLLIPLLGGGIGSMLGMKLYRHKTKHKKFIYGVPLFTVISILIIWFIISTFNL